MAQASTVELIFERCWDVSVTALRVMILFFQYTGWTQKCQEGASLKLDFSAIPCLSTLCMYVVTHSMNPSFITGI